MGLLAVTGSFAFGFRTLAEAVYFVSGVFSRRGYLFFCLGHLVFRGVFSHVKK